MSPLASLPALATATLVLLIAYPTLTVPEAVAPSHPEPAPQFEGGVAGVVRSDVDAPLGGALVRALAGGGEEAARGISEPDGSYRLALPPGAYTVVAGARAHREANASVVVSGALPAQQGFLLEHTGFVLRGVVRDARSGAGLAGALLEAHQKIDCVGIWEPCPADDPASFGPLSTLSGEDGRYALAVEEGHVALRASKAGYRAAWQDAEVRRDIVLDLALQPQPPKNAVLEGRVIDARTGEPVANAWVSAWPNQVVILEGEARSVGSEDTPASPAIYPPPPDCCAEGNSTQTDREGLFRMEMFPGEYGVNAGAEGYGQHFASVTLRENETVRLHLPLEAIPADSVVVRGFVVDSATGQPVGGAWVSVENAEWGHFNGTATREDGRFELRTKPGWTMVWVRAERYGYVAEGRALAVGGAGVEASETGTAEPEPAKPARSTQPPGGEEPLPQPERSYYPWVLGRRFAEGEALALSVELEPKPEARVRIVGYVLNASSREAIAGAWLNVRNEDTGDWGSAQTDEHGSFVILGREGVHTVQAYAERFFGNALVVRVQGPETRVDLALEPGSPKGYCCAYLTSNRAAGAEGAPAPAPAAPGGPEAQDAARTGGVQPIRGEGAASYEASAEGLGPYRPVGSDGRPALQTPGPGLAFVVAGAAGAALLFPGRKR